MPETKSAAWNAALHPRDRFGRFIETGAIVSLWSTPGLFRVRRPLGGSRVSVEPVFGGEPRTVAADRVQVIPALSPASALEREHAGLNNIVTSPNTAEEVAKAVDRARKAIAKVHGVPDVVPVLPVITQVDRAGKLPAAGEYLVSPSPGGAAEPVSLFISPTGVQPALTAVHEIGHVLDHLLLGAGRDWFATSGRGEPVHVDDDLTDWWAAVERSKPYQLLRLMQLRLRNKDTVHWSVIRHPSTGEERPVSVTRGEVDYYVSPREMFARAYAQWIALRSGDPVLLQLLKNDIERGFGNIISGLSGWYPRQWPEEDFAEIAAELDAIFAARGLLKGAQS
ncbi:hypothetical protein EV284_6481 [Streptomyces sp. BK022]|uniref:hypothetical protein n=1 Tax=Streptomyces sp. BK022 TaxID=2512123 RepID=UPI001028DBCB|nr:hypothetical protein [Streptomyces sp. BK022]RZU28315.1 hypothetical protein EV284_6481 [Streptomyces sp. BK022]